MAGRVMRQWGRATGKTKRARVSLVSLVALLSMCDAAPWVAFTSPTGMPTGAEDVVVRAVATAQNSAPLAVGGSLSSNLAWGNQPLGAGTLNASFALPTSLTGSVVTQVDAWGGVTDPNSGAMAWSFSLITDGVDFVTDAAVSPSMGATVFVGVMNASSVSYPVMEVTTYGSSVSWAMPTAFNVAGTAGFVIAASTGNASLLWARRLGGGLGGGHTSPTINAWPWSYVEPGAAASGVPPIAPFASDGAFAVACDASGNVYVAAQLSLTVAESQVVRSIYVSGQPQDATNYIYRGYGFDAYFLSFSPTGVLQWWLRGGNNASYYYNNLQTQSSSQSIDGQEGAFAVAVNPVNGSSIVFAGCTGTNSFSIGTNQVQMVFQGASGSGVAGYAVSTSSAGALMWAVTIQSDVAAAVFGAAMDTQGGVYLTGAFYGTSLQVLPGNSTQGLGSAVLTQDNVTPFTFSGFLAKVNASTGNPLWVILAGGATATANNQGFSAASFRVSVGADGGPIIFGTSTLSWVFFGQPNQNVIGVSGIAPGWLNVIPNPTYTSGSITPSSGFVARFDGTTGNLSWAAAVGFPAGSNNSSGIGIVAGAALPQGGYGAYLGGMALVNASVGSQPVAYVGLVSTGSCGANTGVFTAMQSQGRFGFAAFLNVSLCSSNATSGNPYAPPPPAAGSSPSGNINCSWPTGCGYNSTMVANVAAFGVPTMRPAIMPVAVFDPSAFTCSGWFNCTLMNAIQVGSITAGAGGLYTCVPVVGGCPTGSLSSSSFPNLVAANPSLYAAFANSGQCFNGTPSTNSAWPVPGLTQPTADANFTLYTNTTRMPVPCLSGRAWLVSQVVSVSNNYSNVGNYTGTGNYSGGNFSTGNYSGYNNTFFNSSFSNATCTAIVQQGGSSQMSGCGLNVSMYAVLNGTTFGTQQLSAGMVLMAVYPGNLTCAGMLTCSSAQSRGKFAAMLCVPTGCAAGQTLLTTPPGVVTVFYNGNNGGGNYSYNNCSNSPYNNSSGGNYDVNPENFVWPSNTGLSAPTGVLNVTLLTMTIPTQVCTFVSAWLWPGAAAVGAPTVSTSVTLGGYTTSTFTSAAASAYRSGIATALSLPGSQFVTITSVSDVTVRRHLSAAGVAVGTSILGTSTMTPSALVATVGTLSSNPSALSTALLTAGLTGATVQAIAPAVTLTGCALNPCPSGTLCTNTPNLGQNTSYTCSCPAGQAGSSVSPCVACGAIPQPRVLASFTSPLVRSSGAAFYASIALPSGAADGTPCNFTASYVWSVVDGQGSVQPSLTSGATSTLTLPSSALAAGANARVQLKVCYANDPTFALSCSPPYSFAFAIQASPLIVTLAGGGARISAGSAAVLDGSASRDPDAVSTVGLTYAWTCVGPATNRGCLDASGAAIAPSSAPVLNLTRLPGAPDPGALYAFNLTVSTSDGRSAQTATTVAIVATTVALPVVSIAPLASLSLNPSVRNTLVGSVTPGSASDTVALTWSISPNSPGRGTALGAGVLADPCVAASGSAQACTVSTTSVSSSSFVLLPGALTQGGLTYVFRLTATESNGGIAFAEVSVPVLAAFPVPGALTVSPTIGTALVTSFTLSAPGWSVPGNSSLDIPLLYSFAYISTPGAQPQLLTSFQPQSTASVFLPAGNLSLLVYVQTARGASTNTSLAQAYAQPVTVQLPSVQQTTTAVATAVALAQAGSTDSSLQLAGGVASTFNAAPSVQQSRIDARQQLINAVNVSVATATGASASASSLQVLSSTLATLTAAPAELSLTAQTTAVTVLTAIAGSSQVNAPTAVAVVYSLSNVSVSAGGVTSLSIASPTGANVSTGNASAATTAAAATSVLRPILAAVTTLASTLQGQLTAPGEVPLQIISPAIQTQVALDYSQPVPGRFTRLFNSTIGPTGSPAYFGPLPADALSSSRSAAVNTSFHYLAFDPHSGSVNGTGNVRLLLSGPNGSGLAINNLSAPITIVQPAINASLTGNSGGAVCTFWNTAQQVYSTDGCLGLPNPLPPGVTASFGTVPPGSGSSPLALANALTFGPSSSPLLAGCTRVVLDCSTSSASGSPRQTYLNPDNPLAAVPQWGPTVVRCPLLNTSVVGLGGAYSTQPPALVVYTGGLCKLWQPNNSALCFWNATSQQFQGAGCIASTAPSQCLCGHLTDFSTLSFPSIPVATPAQMLAVKPADLVTKLRLFFFLVIGLFIGMHVGCFAGLAVDQRRKHHIMRTLTTRDLGFTALPNGVWTWKLQQDPLSSAVGPVTGSAVRFARLVGHPYVRLRCAIPEEMLPGELAHVVGRTEGLSVSAGANLSGDIHQLVAAALGKGGMACLCGGKANSNAVKKAEEGTSSGSASCLSCKRHCELRPDEHDADAEAAAKDKDVARMTSTALVFALMWTRLLLPREELLLRTSAASRHFAGIEAPGGGFDTLMECFLNLLGSGLATNVRWLDRARAWRFTFLQSSEGWWSITPGLAFALHSSVERLGSAKGAPVIWQRVIRMLGGAVEGGNGDDFDGDPNADGNAAESPTSKSGTMATNAAPDTDTYTNVPGSSAFITASGVAVKDDPLHFDILAVERSMPHALRALPDAELAGKLWATSLAVALLANFDFSWVVNGGETRDSYGAGEMTMLDAAQKWLDSTVAEYEARRQAQLELLHAANVPPALAATRRLPAAEETAAPVEQAPRTSQPTLPMGISHTARLTSYPLSSVSFDDDVLPPLEEAMPRVRAKAVRLVREWELVQEERVKALRTFSTRGALYTSVQLSRLSGETARAMTTKHEIASIFLGPPQEGLRRWQKFMLVVTTILGALCVEVWFYQVKAASCCSQVRTFLGCDPSNDTPCRGFTGDCADIKAQFADVPLLDGGTVADFECHAFPDEKSPIDSFYVGLIFALCAIPLRWIIGEMLAKSNEAERSEAFAQRPKPIRMAFDFFSFLGLAGLLVGSVASCGVALAFAVAILIIGKRATGKHSWRYTVAEETPSRVMRTAARFTEFKPLNVPLEAFADFLTELILRIEGATGCSNFGASRMARLAAMDEELHSAEVRGKYAEEEAEIEETEAVEERKESIAEAPPRRRSSRISQQWAVSAVRSSRISRDSGKLDVVPSEAPHADGAPHGVKKHDGHHGGGGEEEAEEERREWVEEQVALAVRARVELALGLCSVYAAWAILSWFIFTYGLLIYNLLGSSTESSFVRSWLIALGVDNAKQWQDILRAALQSAALMFVLDRMWIMSNAAWLEQHVDFMSVQATLLTAVPTTFVKRVRRHLDYYAATK